ncbi:Acetoacetyl-CoA synthetase (EC [Olavius algarvensis associated proteobacterium Delta 3]|nr:Acetoacetyl-CoA synthetase (EC [Olavius algarvensis associated proteobacterium Delta 3]
MANVLWQPKPDAISKANMTQFIRHVNERHQTSFSEYNGLYEWSVDRIADFWARLWDFLDIIHSKGYDQVVDDPTKMPGATWFSGAHLNFAENLLRYRDDRTALIFKSETRNAVRITYRELFKQVARLAGAMKNAGVRRGDRVAGFMPNMIESVVAMLAATSLGAVWSSCSPDFGIKGVLDRFGQIEPKILFCPDGYFYNGKAFDSLDRVAGILEFLPATEKVVVVPYLDADPDIGVLSRGILWSDFMAGGSTSEFQFEQVPFEHPLYIMYSSGTTGKPKCMVQSVGGILINQMKELILHTDLKRDDTIFYFTTCGWMMWNWLVCSLAVGATAVLFDGSPFYPGPEALWQLAEDQGITVFGTSARYIGAVEQAGVRPAQTMNLPRLRAILSTGSPLPAEGFEYVYRDIKQDLQLASISGGTDINGCFASGNPIGAVHAGQLQCRNLGMKVKAYDDHGRAVYNQTGELVCEAAAPSMPIYFWNDPDGEKYLDAYFRKYPGVWCHGDFIKITEEKGLIIYGRSDATLNPGGVRIGTADIYSVVETLPEVADSLVVGQDWQNDVRIILFVKLAEGQELTDALISRIKKVIRENTTPRHVPSKVIEIADIPYTLNMKKVELAVRNVIHDKPVTNRDALANPEALDLYKNLEELTA